MNWEAPSTNVFCKTWTTDQPAVLNHGFKSSQLHKRVYADSTLTGLATGMVSHRQHNFMSGLARHNFGYAAWQTSFSYTILNHLV